MVAVCTKSQLRAVLCNLNINPWELGLKLVAMVQP